MQILKTAPPVHPPASPANLFAGNQPEPQLCLHRPTRWIQSMPAPITHKFSHPDLSKSFHKSLHRLLRSSLSSKQLRRRHPAASLDHSIRQCCRLGRMNQSYHFQTHTHADQTAMPLGSRIPSLPCSGTRASHSTPNTEPAPFAC